MVNRLGMESGTGHNARRDESAVERAPLKQLRGDSSDQATVGVRRHGREHVADGLAALELLPTAIWLIGLDGRVLLANRAGREVDARHDGVWIGPDGQPCSGDPAASAKLRRCISRAIDAGDRSPPSDGTAAMARRAAKAPLLGIICTLARDPALHRAAAALFVFDPGPRPLARPRALRTQYGLTESEAALAVALADGTSLKEYARAHRITVNTVRTHLRHALAKTELNRQSQLVALVMRLPAVHASVG